MNAATVVVFLGIASAVTGAFVALRKRKTKGASGCSGGCEHCAMSDICHK